MALDLETVISGIKLKNPTILASGILGVTKASLKFVAQSGAGAVTIKSISREVRAGHKSPIIITFEAGLMNAVGYSNPGVRAAKEEFTHLAEVSVPVIASVIGQEPEDFVRVVQELAELDFAAIEIPLSCPHTPGFGTLAGQGSPEATFKITAAVRQATKLPLWVKISPNAPAISEVAKAAEAAGADAITAVNTLGPGMIINIETHEPILDFKVGGLSGPALRPIAVRCVYDVYQAVKIPIIGTGGITSGRDALEMMMAGATAVGIGSAIYYRGVEVFKKVTQEMEELMRQEGYENLKQVIGLAH